MKRPRIGLLVLALLLIVSAWWGVFEARSGLTVRRFDRENVPMLF